MSITSFKNTVSSRLGIKSVMAVILLISIISCILSSFFIMRQKTLLTRELQTRIESLGQNLVYDCRSFILRKNFPDNILIFGVIREKDILDTYITDSEGVIINSAPTGEHKKFSILKYVDIIPENNWFSTANKNIRRLILPVEVNVNCENSESKINGDIPLEETDQLVNNIRLFGNCRFPTFTPDSGEVTFNSPLYGGGISNTYSIGIKDKKIRIILEKYKSFWGNNEQYLACTSLNDEKTFDISIYDTEKNEIRKIGNTGGINPQNCITPDNKFVITTMAVDGIDKLIKISFEGGAPEQLTFHQGDHWDPKCSPDGKWILYIVRPDRVLWVYNNEKKESMRVFPELELRHWSGCFSPDGKKICYVLFPDSTFASELYVADFPFEKAAQTKKNKYGVKIVSKGFNKWYTGWSRDGKWITYSQAGDIWIVPAEGGDPVNLTAPFKKRERIGYVVIDVSFKNLNKAVAESTRTAIFITIILIGFGGLSAVILVRNVVQPVQNIADATTKVAQGDFNQTVSVTRSDEIGILAESFNTMTGQLQNYREEIETLNRVLETKVRERTAELENKHNELDKAYGDLERAYKELETLDKAKDDFLSLVSHELRTPLGSMLLHAGMLLNKLVDSDEKQTEYHANIVEDCKRLTRLVNDVLDLSKIEAGRMPFTFESLPVRELLSDINSSLRPEFEYKNLHFDYDTVPENTFLHGDRDRIIEVLTNIISNAIKFTPEGGSITVSLSSIEKTATFAVKDTGSGIKSEDIPKVFDRFNQLEDVYHHSEGTGLGMTIAKSIVEHHGGSIWIESEPGKGTTVFFSIPLAQKSPEPLKGTHGELLPDSKKPIKSLQESETVRLLIVDDEKSYRLALADCVRSAGFESLEASDGNKALLMVKEHHPALIILDVMMRGLTGLDVCRKLRDDPETRDIKVIMLSARGQEKEKEEGFEAGADRYMSKPFDYKELIRTIEELLNE